MSNWIKILLKPLKTISRFFTSVPVHISVIIGAFKVKISNKQRKESKQNDKEST